MLIRIFVGLKPEAEQARFARLVADPDVLVTRAGRGQVPWSRLSAENYDLLLLGLESVPAPAEETISAIRELPDEPEVVVVWDQEDPTRRAELLAAGCLAVLYVGLEDATLREALKSLVARRRQSALRRFQALQTDPGSHRLTDFVSSSPSMRRLIATAQRASQSDTSLLILGETGVGKEWLARAIHEAGPRSQAPMVAVSCGAISESLMESELFGHEKGAFTGATHAHRGCFEVAHTGTIFLDEIAEMPVHLQVKLLRVLQERKIRRVGSEREIEMDVRVIAATNRSLEEEIRARRFRSDLYYRIGVVTLTVPPLRGRKEDIVELLNNYLGVFRAKFGRSLEGIDDRAIDALVAYEWPGNVRELINVMERAVLLCSGPKICEIDLPDSISRPRMAPASVGGSWVWGNGTLPDVDVSRPLRESGRELAESFEQRYLTRVLDQTGGRIGLAAKRAGISPRALFEKMRRYGLRKESFREVQ